MSHLLLAFRHSHKQCTLYKHLTFPVSPGAGCSVTDAGEQRGSYNTQTTSHW